MFKEQLAKLIDSRPKAVSQLFSRYGYNVKKPTVQLVIDACVVKKEPFQKDLANVLSNSDSYNGSKLQEWIKVGIGALTGVNALGEAIDGKKADEVAAKQAEAEEQQKLIFGLSPGLVYAFVAVILIMLLLFIIKSRK